MGKGSRCDRPRAVTWHAGGSRLCGGLVLLALLGFHPGRAIAGTSGEATTAPRLSPAAPSVEADDSGPTAALEREAASAEVHYVADWVATTSDNQAMPYIIIDKVDAKVYLFDATGRLQGSAPALLGMVPGDGSAAGVGNRPLSAIGPAERTTPAGRFVAALGPDLHGQDILWVDYDTALALHRVGKGTPAEGRAQRLASPSSTDNRISYGCINVPVPFYEKVVSPAFKQSSGVVYILPETSPARDMFKPGIPTPLTDGVRSGP